MYIQHLLFVLIFVHGPDIDAPQTPLREIKANTHLYGTSTQKKALNSHAIDKVPGTPKKLSPSDGFSTPTKNSDFENMNANDSFRSPKSQTRTDSPPPPSTPVGAGTSSSTRYKINSPQNTPAVRTSANSNTPPSSPSGYKSSASATVNAKLLQEVRQKFSFLPASFQTCLATRLKDRILGGSAAVAYYAFKYFPSEYLIFSEEFHEQSHCNLFEGKSCLAKKFVFQLPSESIELRVMDLDLIEAEADPDYQTRPLKGVVRPEEHVDFIGEQNVKYDIKEKNGFHDFFADGNIKIDTIEHLKEHYASRQDRPRDKYDDDKLMILKAIEQQMKTQRRL